MVGPYQLAVVAPSKGALAKFTHDGPRNTSRYLRTSDPDKLVTHV